MFSRGNHGGKENGVAPVEMDESMMQRAEAKYLNFYEVRDEAVSDAQGPADFN